MALRTVPLRASALGLLVALASCSADNGPTDGGPRRDVVGSEGGNGDGGADRCAPGVDSDHDGLTNDQECALGSDPNVSDSDMDGVNDGAEAHYPRACVADDHAAQRRPPPACMTDAECMPGEHCRGLNPAASDSDGD